MKIRVIIIKVDMSNVRSFGLSMFFKVFFFVLVVLKVVDIYFRLFFKDERILLNFVLKIEIFWFLVMLVVFLIK